MNSILTFLGENWRRFDLERYGTPVQMTAIMVTPRFEASSHVVFLILRKQQAQPVLVAKVPRLTGDGGTLVREASSLSAIQASREGGFDSIPRVIAFERYWNRPVLVETALVGRPLDPPTVRNNPGLACATVLEWLVAVQSAGSMSEQASPDWFERLIAQPLLYLERSMAPVGGERALFERTRRLAETLEALNVPLVVEHGDLSHPNLMLRASDRGDQQEAGVLDWELACVHGLPGCDLFFFLAYVAFARHKARKNRRYVAAFHEAYWGTEPWTAPYVTEYAQRLELPVQALPPLFVLTWARYLAGLLARLDGTAFASGEPDAETISWLRGNRYYALWRHAVEHVDEFSRHW